MSAIELIGSATLHLGDCRAVLRTLDADSIDSIVTDPPYGLGFMGKGWDHAVPGVEFWAEMLRVAKPGAYLLAFGGTRTFHRMVCAIEDAGWEIRDRISRFHDGSAERAALLDSLTAAQMEMFLRALGEPDELQWVYGSGFPKSHNGPWGGTALKPAHEPIIMARKPLVGTVAANVLAYGTGALNIDGCRVPATDNVRFEREPGGVSRENWRKGTCVGPAIPTDQGRWPANVIHDGSEEVLAAFPDAPGQQRSVGPEHGAKPSVNAYGDFGPRDTFAPRIEADTSAARFFYCAKASKADRGEGNTHPTVKPVDLMRYLCRLVTPPGGLVLDPFTGSGSTGKAALLEGFRFVGIEQDAAYFPIAAARLRAAQPEPEPAPEPDLQADLFAGEPA